MQATFIGRKQLTGDIASFSFKPEQSFSYTAGQFIELTLIGHVEHGAPAKRWFTISSSPHEGVITITTRLGTSGFKHALARLQPDAVVDISEPLGDFVLPMLLQTPLVFIAGGIGITPFHSMLGWLAYTNEERPIEMIYSVATEDDIIFQDAFEAARQHVTIVVDQPSAAWGGERGKLTAAMVLGTKPHTPETLFYISGPEPFVQRLQRELAAAGISNQLIVVDEFQGYTED